MIGFTANNVPPTAKSDKSDEQSNEVDFNALWEEALDLSSAPVSDAYSAYDIRHRR